MATRLKTISYCFANSGPVITAANAAQTISRTLYLPESTKSFVNVSLTGSTRFAGGAAPDANIRLLSLQIGSNTATTANCPFRYYQSGEHYAMIFRQQMTAQFTSYWGANVSSLPVNATCQVNSVTSPTGNNLHNGAMETHITYTYDDTSATKIKTVMIPLNAPTGNVVANTTYDTIPALDTYLPEASKTFRNIYVVLQGNSSLGANANLHCIVGNITNTFALDPNNLNSDIFIKKIMDCDGLIGNTGVTHNFQLGSTLGATGKFAHQQAYMVVTYEYDEASTTSIMNSLMLPLELDSPAGSNSTSYARGTREFWIQEPGTITTNRVAFYPFWNQVAAIGSLNMRIGTGSFVAYTDVAGTLGGSNAAMVRKDDAFTLARGRNSLNFDVHRTDTADMMWNVSGYFIVNYTSGKPTAGSCAANKTIRNCINAYGTATWSSNSSTVWAATIPESEYFISAVGTELLFHSNGVSTLAGFTVRVEKTAAEGGLEWMPGYRDVCQTDPETGPMMIYSQMRSNFKRFDGDVDPDRVGIETSRRYEIFTTETLGDGRAGWHSMDILMTYHTIQYNVAGTVANSAGGNVVLTLCRSGNGEPLQTQNVSANASFNFTWHDNTEPVFVEAIGDGGKYTRTADDYAAV